MGRRSAFFLFALLAFFSMNAFCADAPIERAPDTMAARVLGCAACHGARGEGTDNDYFPRLSGKPAGYLYNQLQAFRDGRRKYPPMNYLLAYFPDAYLHTSPIISRPSILRFRRSAPVTVDAKTLALGETLVCKVIHRASARVRRCHAAAMTGMEPAIPGLLGLHANYLSAQLGAWRYGTRSALAPDCMKKVAQQLSERDITAIAAFLASLPAPANPVPVAAGSLKMPLACGSVPN